MQLRSIAGETSNRALREMLLAVTCDLATILIYSGPPQFENLFSPGYTRQQQTEKEIKTNLTKLK